MTVHRGDLVTVAGSEAFAGKPRPALVVQSDLYADHPSLTLCLITSALSAATLFRVFVAPAPANGLRVPSQVMVDKLVTVRRDAIGDVIGHLDALTLQDVDRALRLWLDL